ncbi:MAG: hypothetical protein M3406_10445 [Chloroflexota bacterium]|nr:hypothetical protein [Chloroflexota bacterium]
MGFVVESPRRAAALAYRLRRWLAEYELPGHNKVPCWVTTAAEVVADPSGAIWRAPGGHRGWPRSLGHASSRQARGEAS